MSEPIPNKVLLQEQLKRTELVIKDELGFGSLVFRVSRELLKEAYETKNPSRVCRSNPGKYFAICGEMPKRPIILISHSAGLFSDGAPFIYRARDIRIGLDHFIFNLVDKVLPIDIVRQNLFTLDLK